MRVLEFLGADGGHYGLAHVAEAERVATPDWEPIERSVAPQLLAASTEQLEELWRELGASTAWGDEPPDAVALERWATDELSRPTGKLIMWRVRAPLHATAVPQLGDATPLSDLLRSDPEEVRTWIAFRLLDLAGDPLPDVRYEITLSDGTILDGTTDGDGAARHDDIVAGGASIEFPELPETYWEHEHNTP